MRENTIFFPFISGINCYIKKGYDNRTGKIVTNDFQVTYQKNLVINDKTQTTKEVVLNLLVRDAINLSFDK